MGGNAYKMAHKSNRMMTVGPCCSLNQGSNTFNVTLDQQAHSCCIFRVGLQKTIIFSHSIPFSSYLYAMQMYLQPFWVPNLRIWYYKKKKELYGTLRYNECRVMWPQHTEGVVRLHVAKLQWRRTESEAGRHLQISTKTKWGNCRVWEKISITESSDRVVDRVVLQRRLI